MMEGGLAGRQHLFRHLRNISIKLTAFLNSGRAQCKSYKSFCGMEHMPNQAAKNMQQTTKAAAVAVAYVETDIVTV